MQHLWHIPEPVGQQGLWLESLEEYYFSIEHCPGVRHGNADGISHRPCPVMTCACRQGFDIAVSSINEFQSLADLFSAGPANRHAFADNSTEVVN